MEVWESDDTIHVMYQEQEVILGVLRQALLQIQINSVGSRSFEISPPRESHVVAIMGMPVLKVSVPGFGRGIYYLAIIRYLAI